MTKSQKAETATILYSLASTIPHKDALDHYLDCMEEDLDRICTEELPRHTRADWQLSFRHNGKNLACAAGAGPAAHTNCIAALQEQYKQAFRAVSKTNSFPLELYARLTGYQDDTTPERTEAL